MRDSRIDILQSVLEISKKMIFSLRSESNMTDELVEFMTIRQEYLHQLPDSVGPVTLELRALASEIAHMDTKILSWCKNKHSTIANEIGTIPRRHSLRKTEAKIICHLA